MQSNMSARRLAERHLTDRSHMQRCLADLLGGEAAGGFLWCSDPGGEVLGAALRGCVGAYVSRCNLGVCVGSPIRWLGLFSRLVVVGYQ